ncbi:MAG: PH domain-containing protein [Geodermatophilaceae bacterium]|nr:PH domain-containing protein [Geodermatophilaceae bacterium]
MWALEGLVTAALLLAAALAAVLLSPGDLPGPLRFGVSALPWLVGVYAVVAVGIRPQLRYRVHRWEVTGDAVHTRTGWLTQEWTIIPIARIQTVDIHRGALQRLFGLASVTVLTASSKGTVAIVHLEADVAQRLAPDLASRAAAVRDESA